MIANLLLAANLSVVDDRICPPPTMEPHDLGDLLSIVAEKIRPDGVLMLSGPWARYITPIAEAGGPQGSPTAVTAGDWTARVVDGDTWIRWRGPDKHAIWTCEIDAIPPGGKDSPLIDDNPVVTAANFHTWHETTGVPWVGTPGMTGNALLVDGWRQMNPKAEEPFWSKPGIWYPMEEHPAWPFGEIEQPFTPGKWSRDHDGPLHGYDLNKAYLSAYAVVELPVGSLTHHKSGAGGDAFDGSPGIWRVKLSPWQYVDLLPDPAGYAPTLEDGSRWLTTPTLTLLQQLTERGDYGGFEVLEYWGLGAGRRVTRKWAELINDVASAGRPVVAYAAKQVYKQTYGMWARSGRVARPDWRAFIIATARCNLWRKMDKALRTNIMGVQQTLQTVSFTEAAEQAPMRVETDCVFYAGITNWERDAPPGFKLDESGIKLGHFKPYTMEER
jgi:hypothetical protein